MLHRPFEDPKEKSEFYAKVSNIFVFFCTWLFYFGRKLSRKFNLDAQEFEVQFKVIEFCGSIKNFSHKLSILTKLLSRKLYWFLPIIFRGSTDNFKSHLRRKIRQPSPEISEKSQSKVSQTPLPQNTTKTHSSNPRHNVYQIKINKLCNNKIFCTKLFIEHWNIV
jgi:hypothetical protein